MPENAFDPQPNKKNEIECGRRPIQSNRFGNNRKWVIEKKRKSPDKKRIQPMAIGKIMMKYYEALSQLISFK